MGGTRGLPQPPACAEGAFDTKQAAATYIRKTPHLVRYGQAGCYMRTESRRVARDGKQTVTVVQEAMWTFQELAEMAGD